MAAAMDDAQKIAQLREKFLKKYVESSNAKVDKFDERDLMRIKNDDLYVLSFIHWKKEVVDDAVEMVSTVLQWRKENNVTDLSIESIGMQYMKLGAVYIYGRDLGGHRVMCSIGRINNKENKEAIRKILTFYLERLQRNEPGQHVTFILDTHKTAMSNVDMGMIRFIIDAFSTYFPDLLDKIIILDMPWIMNAIWNIVKQWMSEEQRSKTVFCSRKDLKKYISPDELPTSMAGKVDWTYSFPPFPDDIKGQEHDFLNDPMNFKKEEKPETSESQAPKEDEMATSQPNGYVPHPRETEAPKEEEGTTSQSNGDVRRRTPDDGDFNNNNHQVEERKLDTANLRRNEPDHKDQNKEPEASQSTSGNGEPARVEVNGPKSLDLPLTSTPAPPQKIIEKKVTPQEPVLPESAASVPVVKEDAPKQMQQKSVERVLRSERMPNNVSFKSITGPLEQDVKASALESSGKVKIETDEIMLGNLLVMSPVSELFFTLEGERLESHMNIRNQNNTKPENEGESVYVAFKVKTTSPERYHVKPSVGVVLPGESVRIRVYLNSGYESTMTKDRFLLLYKRIPVNGDRSLTHGEIVNFWKQNNDKALHFEHRLRVKLEGTSSTNIPIQRKQSEDDPQASTPNGSPQVGTSFLSGEEKKAPPGVDISQLHQQLGLLNHKVSRLENDSRWMRRRMRHVVGILFIIILLLFFILYEVTMLSYKMSPASESTRTDL